MKSVRIPLIVFLSVTVIGIILGSFLDLQISTAIASPTNNFALAVSAIGPTIGFAGVAVMGGGFIAYAVKGKYPIGLKILFYVLAACCYGVSIYYPGMEYFGINGFYHAAPEIVGYIIVAPIEAAAVVGGFFLFKDVQNKNLWIVFCIIVGLLLIALLAVIPTIKDNMHRPRFRTVSTTPVEFHNWWQACKDYKELRELYDIESDNFKSFPSGHTAEASILLVVSVFFPLAGGKLKEWQTPMFVCSCILVVFVALARILAAAHYLSDVSFGAFIVAILVFIANEVVMRIKPLHLEEKAEEE